MAARIDLAPSCRGKAGIEARRRAANRGDSRVGELERCAGDPAYFTDSYCVIDDAQGGHGSEGTTPFKLWPGQRQVLNDLKNDSRTIILKARQLGISWLVCSYALWLCIFRPGQVVILLSKDDDAAKELLRRISVLYERLPDWLQAACPRGRNDPRSKKVYGWSNGSYVKSFAATKGAGRSWTASLVVMDEAGWMFWAKQVYTAAKPTMEAGGQLIILSTANGAQGLFYDLWRKAAQGLDRFRAVFLPWWARPGRDQAWYDLQVAESTDPDTIKQEYPANAMEAFLASGRIRFPSDWLAPQAAHALKLIDDPLLLPQSLRPLEGLRVYEAPRKGSVYFVSADVAEGRMDKRGSAKGDYSAGVVFKVESGLIFEVATLHGKWEPDEFARRLTLLGGEYFGCPIVVERNNHGHSVILALRNRSYPAIGLGLDGEYGWLTTSLSKPLAVDALAVRLRDDRVRVRYPEALSEMQVYRVQDNGSTSAPEGRHDDLVMAWAIGVGWIDVAQPRALEFL